MKNLELFLKKAHQCRKKIEQMTKPTVVTHYDCDGLSAGAIVCKFLEINGVNYKIKIVRKLDDELIENLKKEDEIIFSDLGGGNKKINELEGEVVIFDHHQTEGIEKTQLNPHLFGMDGGTEMSGSSCTYFALEQLPEISIVGAVGDMQYPMQGANKLLLQRLEKEGIVEAAIDLRIYGRMSRPLPQLLAYCDEPYLPGLANNEARCEVFLESIGLKKIQDRWPTYNQLNKEDKQKLIAGLATYLTEYYKTKIPANYLVNEVYNLKKFENIAELYDAGEFSTMLNACGRHKKEQVGLAICLGDQKAIEEGKKILAHHRKALKDGIEYATKNIIDLGPYLFLDARGIIDDGIIGVIAGMVFGSMRKKPILAIALDEKGQIKISTRGTNELVKNGLNLGLALKETIAKVGGQGGGHKIAAGATIPKNALNEFLVEFEKVLQKQLKS
ncbi:MAG: DHH family phosphoesterase [Candidatus Omnitrophica bacterium]|nr:DHH family phosphoesterase [Candidatus Omnitrophota bacterium]